jgi:hypothetical protein
MRAKERREKGIDMSIDDLYRQLLAAYTEKNLHRISTRIIDAFRGKRFGFIKEIMRLVDGYVDLQENQMHRLFARLIMLYHPDRLQHYLQRIKECHESGDQTQLGQFSHLLVVLENIDRIRPSMVELADPEFAAETSYGYDESEFDRVVDVEEEVGDLEDDEEEEPVDFVTALKQKEYGNLEIEFSRSDLENTEGELVLSDAGIEDLAGIQNCRNLTILDLSQNEIYDITPLANLQLLEELYLSENSISDISALAFLTRLKKLDLAFTCIDDISPLFDLPGLEYLNVIGNKIPADQLKRLRDLGAIVISGSDQDN